MTDFLLTTLAAGLGYFVAEFIHTILIMWGEDD